MSHEDPAGEWMLLSLMPMTNPFREHCILSSSGEGMCKVATQMGAGLSSVCPPPRPQPLLRSQDPIWPLASPPMQLSKLSAPPGHPLSSLMSKAESLCTKFDSDGRTEARFQETSLRNVK